MIHHLDDVHPQYAHPKNPTGHPLPLDILNTFTLTSLEQRDAIIPESQWLMPLFDSDDDKENQPGPSTPKRKNKNAGNTMRRKLVNLHSLFVRFISFACFSRLHVLMITLIRYHFAFLPLLLHVFVDFIASNCIVLLRNQCTHVSASLYCIRRVNDP